MKGKRHLGRVGNLGLLCRKRKDSVAAKLASRHAVGMNRSNIDRSGSGEAAGIMPATGESGEGMLRPALLVMLALLGLSVLASCESVPVLGDKKDPGPVQIREVTVLKAPFYTGQPNKKSIPFIYLTRGTALEWLQEKDSFAKVQLANGTSGWVPSAALGSASYGRPEDLAQPESLATPEEKRDRLSKAIRTGKGDESLNQFNIPD